MKIDKTWAFVTLLVAVCLGQAYSIRAEAEQKTTRQEPSLDDFLKAQDRWISEVRKHMLDGTPIPFRRFDDLFNDQFFGHQFDPFGDIQNLHKRLNPLFPMDQRPLFERSWDDWFQDRMDVSDINTDVKTTDKEVVLTLKIPNLSKESLKIDINDDRIRVSYDARTVQNKTDAKGREYFKSESIRHFEKIMPIPDGANPNKNRMVQEGDSIKIIFEKGAAVRKHEPE